MTWSEAPGVVTLPDGRLVRARGLRQGPAGGESPERGYYLLGDPPGEMDWPAVWIRWPDFRLPADREAAIEQLRDAHVRCLTERVEIACGGGIGRTGTALGVLAVLSGLQSEDAVEWVRANYRRRAVETPWQRRWLSRLEL